VTAWKVTIRPVRTISRKDPVPLTGWIESRVTWATGSRDSSTAREASTSLSVESISSSQRENSESSETICRAPSLKQRDEDMAHTSWRHGESVNYNGPKVECPLQY
jgi:hypothetical protein